MFLDIGCGVGNSFYPLLQKKPQLIIKGFDISQKAVDMASTHPLYIESLKEQYGDLKEYFEKQENQNKKEDKFKDDIIAKNMQKNYYKGYKAVMYSTEEGIMYDKIKKLYNNKITLRSLDIVKEEIPEDFKKADYSMLMFVLSAIMPDQHYQVLKKIYDALNKDGILYFRDYARYDMAQVRFSLRKKNKIEDNLYMRHDKTLAFYFEQKEIENLLKTVGFEIMESKVICRKIQNRKDNKTMHRLWLQIKVKKTI